MTAYLLLSSTAILAALWLDRMLGETRRFHPLVGFGLWAKYLEGQLYPNSHSQFTLWAMGVVAWLLAVMPVVIVSAIVTQLIVLSWGAVIYWLLSVVVIYIAIGARSLKEHALDIFTPLQQGDLISARQALSMLVSRDTDTLTEPEIATATIESVIENSHDSVIGVFFWYLVFGIPGVVLFRLANTLDAMWGYRNARYNFFGRWAARIDDMLGYVSARVTVLLFALQKPRSLAAAWHYGRRWYSPNAGPVMAAGAGALAIQLGGDQRYNGELKQRPMLGAGDQPHAAHIGSALLLVERSYYLLPLLLLVVSLLGHFL
jgi:adenosylcobinamide-phosphate synthase|tara:strand:- start:647 stop:1597 length:951 start_codon:yes stop_codon:yes gene_type:complete